MMNKTQSTVDLRLHVDDDSGVIWFGTDKESWKPHPTELHHTDFARQDWVVNAERIRLFGTRKNAGLISALVNAKRSGYSMPPTMCVCSPTFIPTEAKQDPGKILRLMDDVRLPGSCGGWHELDEYDFNVYHMLHMTDLQPPADELGVDSYLRTHPAYPALTFITTHNKTCALDLLKRIVDPRWFIDPAHPDRTSRLRSYLGLRPEVMDKVFIADPRSKQEHRAKLVLNSWSTGDYSSAAIDDPTSFLMRTVRDAKDRQVGLLKASVRFISFMRGVWLDAIAPRGRTLFVPKYFFDTPEEVQAFEEHMAAHAKRQRL